MYYLLDKFFILFHTVFVIFNLTGWIWKKTRMLNLICLLLTAFSWLGLGIWYGIGYCPFTHWHWQVRYKLGYYDMPYSYMKFLLETITGLDLNALLVDHLTAIFFSITLVMSSILNLLDWSKRKKQV
jgi:hypothetical protein